MPTVCPSLDRMQFTRLGNRMLEGERFYQASVSECSRLRAKVAHISGHLPIGQDRSRVMIDGMPEPPWGVFAADKRPHFVHLSFARALNVYTYLVGIQCA